MNPGLDGTLRVSLAYGPGDIVPLGRLAIANGRTLFGYDDAYVVSGRRFHPLWSVPDRAAIVAENPRALKGLHGAFADSLPDAWGFELMRRRLALADENYDALSPLDRLALVGHTGVGALVYDPDRSESEHGELDLDRINDHAQSFLEGATTGVVEELARLGGSSGGARPKIFIAHDAHGHTISGTAAIPDGYEAWIVKFRSRFDPVDIGPLEAAFADMARAAGIDVAPTALIPSSGGHGYFSTRRFDRSQGNPRRHVLSVAAILDVDWSEPSIDYKTLLSVVRSVTQHQGYVEEMFRRMVFNVRAHNRDDHTKQHAFLQTQDGSWILAPAYDLTPSAGPGGEHYLAVNGKGANIGLDDIFAVAQTAGIRSVRAKAIVDDVKSAVSQFTSIAKTYGVTGDSRRAIEAMLR